MKTATSIVSSLEKCRQDLTPSDYPRIRHISALRGERVNLQFLLWADECLNWDREISVKAECSLGDIRLRKVKNIHVSLDTFPQDETRGTKKILDYPGSVYPDLLEELEKGENTRIYEGLTAFWADITIPENAEEGKHKLSFTVTFKNQETICDSAEIEVIAASLPKSDYKCTLWFHVDCLADYYEVPVYSERHWEIIESFAKNAAENRINTLLVPVLTPPLDTAVGHYRPTTQLVAVERGEDGGYSFDFTLLDRYIEMAKRVGMQYFEISHLFSQWGAKYAPKVEATVYENGTRLKKRIFGWDTPGTEGEYPRFLEAFIPALRAHLDELGILERCIFHISDEPNEETVAGYRAAKKLVAPLLSNLKVADACGHSEFAADGTVELPIPCDTKMDGFLALDLPERWTYYCCAQTDNAPNRFICYPSFRNRILGTLMYKYEISGFLQWAYNFYYTCGSVSLVNPYTDTTGDGWVPGGDTFMVYPGRGGKPVESLRLLVFAEAFDDLMALKKCEELCGREAVIELIDSEGAIDFKHYPENAEYILLLRHKINELIKEHIKN